MTDYKTIQNLLSSRHIPFHTVKLSGTTIEKIDRLEVYDSSYGLLATKMIISDLFANYPVKITSNIKREAILIELNK